MITDQQQTGKGVFSAKRETSKSRCNASRRQKKGMIRFTQIFGAMILTAVLVLIFAVLLSGEFSVSTSRSDVEKGEETFEKIGSYSKIALLSMREPDNQLAMPVKGIKTRQISDTWGAARSEGREHNGQDIFAKRGTPVYSATEGYVLRVGENRLGGNVVFIFGAGGRRYYYAHLENFAPELKAGDYVTTDTLIGFVGTSGNAKNTPPHLHFSVYGAGGAMNPLPLLSDRN